MWGSPIDSVTRVGLVSVTVAAFGGLVLALVVLTTLDVFLRFLLLSGYLVAIALMLLLVTGLFDRYKTRRAWRKQSHLIRKFPGLIRVLSTIPEELRWFIGGRNRLRGLYHEQLRDKLDNASREQKEPLLNSMYEGLDTVWRVIMDEIRNLRRSERPTTTEFLDILSHLETFWQGLGRLLRVFGEVAEEAMPQMTQQEEKVFIDKYGDTNQRFGDFRAAFRRFLVDVNEKLEASRDLETVPTLPQLKRPARYE